MAVLKFENKRTGEKSEIFHGHLFHYIEKKIKNLLGEINIDEIEISSREGNVIYLRSTEEIFNYINKYRYSGLKTKQYPNVEQSYDGVIHNTLIALDKQYTIFCYIYNELQDSGCVIVDKGYIDLISSEIINHLKENNDGEYINNWLNLYNDIKDDDVFYVYIDNYVFNLSSSDINISYLLENKEILKWLKEKMKENDHYSLRDFFDEIIENELVYEIEDILTENQISEIYLEKFKKVTPEILDKYFFENNYNIITVLKDLKS